MKTTVQIAPRALILPLPGGRRVFGELALSLIGGLVFTTALFFGIAQLQKNVAPEPVTETDDLRVVTIPLEPPPLPPVTPAEDTPPVLNVLGLEPVPAQSEVKIAVNPPDIDALLPPPPLAPAAAIQVGRLYPEFKPKVAASENDQRIYQTSEVDQPPMVLNHVVPKLPASMRDHAEALRVTFIVVIDRDGSVKSIRVSRGSGNSKFDKIMLDNIPQWTFAPAVRRGKRVKCIIEQAVHFKLSASSPFES